MSFVTALSVCRSSSAHMFLLIEVSADLSLVCLGLSAKYG